MGPGRLALSENTLIEAPAGRGLEQKGRAERRRERRGRAERGGEITIFAGYFGKDKDLTVFYHF